MSGFRGWPPEALIEAVEPEFGRAKLFRPNRDIRFSADKSPYKTKAAAAAGGFGTSAYYVSLSSEGPRSGV